MKEKETPKKKLFKNMESPQESLKQELEACLAAQTEWKDKFMRANADLANFQKRMEKERTMWAQVVQSELLLKLLEIIDNFDRAVEAEQVSDGIQMIHDSMHDYLNNVGVTEISYKQFDPTMHEALMQIDSDEHKAGDIVQVMQKGYMLKGQVLRPAKVSVAK